MVIRQEREVIIKIVYELKRARYRRTEWKKLCFDCHSITWKSFFYRLLGFCWRLHASPKYICHGDNLLHHRQNITAHIMRRIHFNLILNALVRCNQLRILCEKCVFSGSNFWKHQITMGNALSSAMATKKFTANMNGWKLDGFKSIAKASKQIRTRSVCNYNETFGVGRLSAILFYFYVFYRKIIRNVYICACHGDSTERWSETHMQRPIQMVNVSTLTWFAMCIEYVGKHWEIIRLAPALFYLVRSSMYSMYISRIL